MTPTRRKTVSVPRSKWRDYFDVAENFFKGAELAKEFEYWNAAGVLIVHAAIAYADSISVRFGGLKSRGEDHSDSINLVRSILPLNDSDRKALRRFERMVHEKNRVSYEGEIYTGKDIELLWKNLSRFRAWASDRIKS